MKTPAATMEGELYRQACRRAENLARWNEIKRILGCQHCGRHDLPFPRLHGHHEGRYRWIISKRLHRAWENLVQEMAEIAILCDRCHGWRTAGLISIPPHVRVIVPAFVAGEAIEPEETPNSFGLSLGFVLALEVPWAPLN